MTTLITVMHSSGSGGRCDAKCYDAKDANCDCVCGGLNHGKGLKSAIQNTSLYAEEMIKEYTGRKGLTDFTTKLGEKVIQPSLF